MILKVIIEDQLYELNVPDQLIAGASDFFDKMDRDMAAGWQMSQTWVEAPNLEQRCQIVGDKLLTALETENHDLGRMMAGYILSRVPRIDVLDLDTSGEIQNTLLKLKDGAELIDATHPRPVPTIPENRMQALAQAGQEVSKVFKAGRLWKFSVLDRASGEWLDGATCKTEDQAERLREQAVKLRYDELSPKH